MASKKPTKPTPDALIGREVRIHADVTYPNGNAHAWAGFPGKVLKHNGKSVYQINMAEGQAVAVFALDQFDVIPLPGEHTAEMHRPWAILDTPGNEIGPCNRSLVDHTQYLSSTDWQNAFLTRYQLLSRQCEAMATAMGFQPLPSPTPQPSQAAS